MKIDREDYLIPALCSDKESGLEALWVEPSGEIWTAFSDGKPYQIKAKFAAAGAPWEMALGAMMAGVNAEEAVRICINNHDSAAGEIQVERLASRLMAAE